MGKESPYNEGEKQADMTGQKDPLEEGIAIHSSIVAWRIPWIGEPGGLQSIGPKESDMMKATEHACTHIIIISIFKYLFTFFIISLRYSHRSFFTEELH